MPSPATVLGDFDDARLREPRASSARFTRRGDAYVIETEEATGAAGASRWSGSPGSAPLQQYLLAPEPGRTQAFDFAWDTERGAWYDLYPGQADRRPTTGCTGPAPTRAGRRAAPSATPPATAATTTRRPGATRPSMAEIGVGCEACHGPGEAHAAWADGAGRLRRGPLAGGDGAGAHRRTWRARRRREIEQCAGCHSRRESLHRRQPAAGDAVSRQLTPWRCCGDGLYCAGRADRGRGLRVRLVPAGEDVRARGPLQRLPRAACG